MPVTLLHQCILVYTHWSPAHHQVKFMNCTNTVCQGLSLFHLVPVTEVLTASQQHVIQPQNPCCRLCSWETNSETLGLRVEIIGGVFSETVHKGSKIKRRDFTCNAVAVGASAGPLVNGGAVKLPQLLRQRQGGQGFLLHINRSLCRLSPSVWGQVPERNSSVSCQQPIVQAAGKWGLLERGL